MRLLMFTLALLCAGQVCAAEVTVKGPDGAAVVLSAAQIKAMPRVTFTFAAHGESHTFEGPQLFDLLTKVGVPAGKPIGGAALADVVIVTASDGYQVVFGLAELDPATRPHRIILADTSDGQALRDKDGAFKVVAEGDLRPARSVRQVQSIELRHVGGKR